MSSTTTAHLPSNSAKISTMRPVTDCLTYYQNGVKVIYWDNNIQLALNGDIAKTHDPTKHFSPELAIANRQAVHCESMPSEEFTALAPCVWSHGMYFLLSIFWFASRLSGSNLKEPKHCKQTNLYSRNQDLPLTSFSLLVQPKRAWSVGWSWMKLRTEGPGLFHSPLPAGHQPPVRRYFNTSWLANCKAMSRLGARWFE